VRDSIRLIAVLCLVSFACVSDDLWRVSDRPTADDVEILLSETDPASIRREYLPSEVPAIPVRKRLRPCCAFGSEIYATLGPIPIPWYNIPNIVDPSMETGRAFDADCDIDLIFVCGSFDAEGGDPVAPNGDEAGRDDAEGGEHRNRKGLFHDARSTSRPAEGRVLLDEQNLRSVPLEMD